MCQILCSNYIFQYYTNITRNSQLRHGSELNVNFADGHAKAMRWKAGTLGGNVFGLPKSQTDQVKYCANPDAPYTQYGMTLACRDWVTWVDKQISWFND